MGITDKFRRGERTETDRSWGVWIVALVFGLIAGGLGAWATANLGISTGAFLVVTAVTVWYLLQQPIATAALGKGMYVSALLLILAPVLYYIPMVMRSSEAETAEGAGTFIGSLMGLVIWGFAFLLLGIVIGGVGYLINRRAQKKLAS